LLYSICIATYKRRELLEKLLDSLSKQKLPDLVELEVIIVDNDKSESAKEVVERAEKKLGLNLKYFTQAIKNISLTRNVSVAEAKGEYILFIDDDEIASSEWISHLHNVLFKYNADAVFGRVVSYFEPNEPEWIKNCFIYNRGSPKTGTRAINTRTGNVMIKSSLLRTVEGPFEPAYGLTGGSDTKLFDLLKKNGAKYINCYEAVTYEYVSPERANLKWLFIRAFRGGNDFVRREIEFQKKHKFTTRIHFLSIGIVCSITSLFLSAIFFFNKTKRLNWALKFSANWGKVAAICGYSLEEYK